MRCVLAGMRGLCVMIEYEELQQVASSNQRREDRLARVRGKDFSKRLQDMEVRVGGGGWVWSV